MTSRPKTSAGSVYAQTPSSAGSVYAQKAAPGGSVYAQRGSPPSAAKKKPGGLLGAVEGAAHTIATKADLAAHDIKSIPGGLIDVGTLEAKALAHDASQLVHHPTQTQSLHDFVHGNSPASKSLFQAEKQTVASSKTALQHPGRDPFQTLMTVLPLLSGGASAAARAGYAADALGAGEAGNAARALSPLHRPPMPPRLLNVGESQVALHHSAQPLQRALQAGYDRVLQHGLDTNPEGRIAAHAQRRIGGSLDESARVQQRLRDAPAGALNRAARRLTAKGRPGQGRVSQAALELTSVNTLPEKAAEYHLGQAAKGIEPVRNRAVAKLYQTVADKRMLVPNERGDVVVNAAEHPALAQADLALATVQGRGDEILARYGIRSPVQLAERVNAPARVREGATYETPTPGKLGIPSPALKNAQQRVASLENRHNAEIAKRDAKLQQKPLTKDAAAERLAELNRQYDQQIAAMTEVPANAKYLTAKRNAKAGVRARRGLAPEPTVLEAARKSAERRLSQALERNPDHPVAKRVTALLDERRRLEEALQTIAEEKALGNRLTPAQEAKILGRVGDSTMTRDEIATRYAGQHAERANRLGGALSVARDELERAQAAAAARVRPTGLLGGETARPGRGFVSYATEEKRAPASPAAASPGPVVGEARAPITSAAFTGGGIEKGMVPADVTGQAARHFHSIVRFVNTTERRNAAIRTGSDVRRSTRDVLVKVPGDDHAKISQAVEEVLGRKNPTIDDIAGLHAALDAYREDLVPGITDRFAADAQHPVGTSAADAAAARGLDAPSGYKWVDREALGELARPSVGPRGKIARAADTVNSAVTAATVYFKIGHLGTRALTNASTNIIQGSADPAEIAKSVGLWKALTDEDRIRALAAAGQHGIAALPHEGTGRVAHIAAKGANWWARRIDAPFRFNSIAYEARRAGFDTPAKFRDMLDKLESPHAHNMNAAEAAKVDWVAKRANREGIAYDRLSNTERRFITRAFWFYPWVAGATRFAVNTLMEHPYKAGALGVAGVEGRQAQQRELGDVPTYEGGLFRLKDGPTPLVADFSTFSPFSTPADVLNTVARPKELSGFLNPVYAAGNSLINGQTPYGSPSTSPIKDALATLVSPAPESQILTAYLNRNKPQGRRMFPASPALHGTLSPLLRSLLGPGTPRRFNPAAAHSAAARERTGR